MPTRADAHGASPSDDRGALAVHPLKIAAAGLLIGACSSSAVAGALAGPTVVERSSAPAGEPTSSPEGSAASSDAAGVDAAVTRPRLVAPRAVRTGFLREPSGRAVILRGTNLTGRHKYSPYLDEKTQTDYARVRHDWGLNSLRLVTTWAAIEPTRDGYDAAFLDKLAERVAWAASANLLVVVDMHQDVFGEGFSTGGGDGAPRWACDAWRYASFTPAFTWTANYLSADVQACYDKLWTDPELQAHFAEAWRRVARRLASFDNVVGFDIINEPFFGSYWPTKFEADRLMPFYEKVVAAVRSEAPEWIAFIEPASSRNFTHISGLPKPAFANFVFSPHSYDPMAELGLGFDGARRSKVIDNLAALWSEAKALGGALWIGEYGGTATAPGIGEYMSANYDGMGAVAASSAYWDYTNGGYGLLAEDGGEQRALLDAVARPYPEAVAGTPIAWRFDAATRTFTFEYHADRSVTVPTVLSVPARALPAGYQIVCNACKATKVGAYVLVTEPPAGDPAVVTLRP